MSLNNSPRSVAVIGGGPAGLMAAEMLVARGARVDVYDRMPSLGRKLLMAGKGGLNITHSEPFDRMVSRYAERRGALEPALRRFGPDALRDWVHGLGIETFVGTSGRVFPKEMKAAPLLRAWLHRLREAGARMHVRHRWSGWIDDGALSFISPAGTHCMQHDTVVLALGGGSWPQLGSDAAWVPLLEARGVSIAPLRPANCGFNIAWSTHFRERFAGHAVKPVVACCEDARGVTHRRQGELVVTANGLEGGLIYTFAAALRDALEVSRTAVLELDLAPGWEVERLRDALAHPRGSRSLSSHVQSRTGLRGVKMGLIRERLSATELNDPQRLASAIKALPIELVSARAIEESISTAGGVRFEALDENLMLREIPGVFCAGEMLDWEAPTGGYLLTACLATGRAAGEGVLRWLERRNKH